MIQARIHDSEQLSPMVDVGVQISTSSISGNESSTIKYLMRNPNIERNELFTSTWRYPERVRKHPIVYPGTRAWYAEQDENEPTILQEALSGKNSEL